MMGVASALFAKRTSQSRLFFKDVCTGVIFYLQCCRKSVTRKTKEKKNALGEKVHNSVLIEKRELGGTAEFGGCISHSPVARQSDQR